MADHQTRTIEIDFDVHQLIELERRSFEESPNDALRRLLGLGETTTLPPTTATPALPESDPRIRHGELSLRGKTFRHAHGREAMTIVLRELANADPGFLQRCFRHPDNQGRKRRHIAQTLDELYPGRPDLHRQHERLPGGWLIGTNISNARKRQILIMAAQCAGIDVGKELVVPALGIAGVKDD